MTQQFFINKDSILPTLRLELIYDGRHDYNKFWDAIQNSDITFTMTNVDTNIKTVKILINGMDTDKVKYANLKRDFKFRKDI